MRPTTRLKFCTALLSLALAIFPNLALTSILRLATAQESKEIGRKQQTPASSSAKPGKPKSPLPDKPQRAYAPHWTTADGFSTIIYIRNVHITKIVRARLSLVLKHRTLTLAEQSIDPMQTVSIDVRKILTANKERAEQEGGAIIEYMGSSPGAINAFEQVINVVDSLAFSFPFMQDGAKLDGPLDAVAWYRDRQTEAYVSVQNTSKKAVRVTPTVFMNGSPRQLEPTKVKANAEATIRLPDPEDIVPDTGMRSGGVRINHDGEAGAIIAQGWAMNPQIGFSTAFTFHQGGCACKPGESHHLYGVGVRIGNGDAVSPGAVFEPLLALRNNSNKPLKVTPIFKYQENGRKKISLPGIELGPQGTTVKNLRQYQLDGTIPAWVTDGDIELVYDSDLAALIAELSTVEALGSIVAGAPLTCAGNGALHMAYWRTDADWDSVLAVENILDEVNVVEITISHPRGLYVFNKTLAAGERVMISVKELQQNQTPDKNGHTIPISATMGGMNVWSDNVHRGLVINGMIMNLTTKTCGYCGSFGMVEDYGLTDYMGSNCYLSGFPDEYEIDSVVPVQMCMAFSTGQSGTDQIRNLRDLTSDVLEVNNSTSVRTIGAPIGYLTAETQNVWSTDQSTCNNPSEHLSATGFIQVAPRVDTVTASGATEVTQKIGNTAIIHFVTPKGAANSTVTLTATITPNTSAMRAALDWEGATENGSNPLQATVSKDAAAKHVVKIKISGTVRKELRVWVVWATISSGDRPIEYHEPVDTINGTGAIVGGGYDFDHTIQPSTIITDDDRPDFSGSKSDTNGPPGGNHWSGVPLSGGADKKWDGSRQVKNKWLLPSGLSPSDFSDPGMPNDIPYPTNEVVGNDDTDTAEDELNDPYNDDGLLGGWDFPQLPVAHSKGAANNEIELRLHFREFTRLEIEGTWFRISDYYLWRIHLKLRKTNGKWVNNGTTKALDNSGF